MSQQIQSITQEANNSRRHYVTTNSICNRRSKQPAETKLLDQLSHYQKGNKANMSANTKPINFHFVRDQIVESLLDVRLISTKDQIGYHD